MQPTHLIILIHGLYGSPSNLRVVEQELLAQSEKKGQRATSSSSSSPSESLVRSSGPNDEEGEAQARPKGKKRENGPSTDVLVVKSNEGVHTWDGIDVCAHRVAEEVDREVEKLEDAGRDVVGVSVMGYSLGGLIGRYLVGILHSRQPSFFARHNALSFSTAATPHLGQLRYGTRVNSIMHTVGPQMFSRTGRQLFMYDQEPEWSGRCLLSVMADPNHIFAQALRQFDRHLIVANGCNDRAVPYPSASISLTDPFADPHSIHVETDDHHIVQSHHPLQAPHSSFEEQPDPESLPVNDIDVLDDDGEKVQISVKVIRQPKVQVRAREVVREYKGRVIQRYPPLWVLPYPWPFSHILFLLMPFLIPIFLIYITGLFTYQTYRSRRRIRWHRDRTRARSRAAESSSNEEGVFEPLLEAAQEAASTTFGAQKRLQAGPSDRARVDGLDNDGPQDRDRDQDQDGRSTPPLSTPPDEIPTLLRLTSSQKEMIKNLHLAMPDLKSVIGWFPWAFNSHAVIICRDTNRFAWHEDGRGVVRAWAQFVLASSETEEIE